MRRLQCIGCPTARPLLFNQARLHQTAQFLAGNKGIHLIQPAVHTVVDVIVLSQVDQGQTLTVVQVDPGKPIQPLIDSELMSVWL